MAEKGIRWKEMLLDAAELVQGATDRLSSEALRARVVGTGASGDKTLLADREAERRMIGALSAVKGLRILSEEAGEVGDRRARLLAILDPLDGSSNFERGIPFYCVSVAIVEGGRLEGARAALVRNLVTGDVYYAEKDRGVTKNGRAIRTSRTTRIADAVVGVDLSRTSEANIAGLAPLISSVRRQVHYGANALELCFLAEGRTDAFVDLRGRTRIVDFAGAYLIAREAGAVVTCPSGSELDPALDLRARFGFVASASTALHRQLLKLVPAA